MKGLEISKEYYELYGADMIHRKFRDYEDRIACGLVGDASECYGFDDEYSHTGDWGPGFCMWLNDRDFEAIGKHLETEYKIALPSLYKGYSVKKVTALAPPKVGAARIAEFYQKIIGFAEPPETGAQWMAIPEERLSAAVNGEVFRDDLGQFTAWRNILLGYYPEHVWLRRIADKAIMMGKWGQTAYIRSVKRRDHVAAYCSLEQFIAAAIGITYLLNRTYRPNLKWAHKGMKDFKILSGVAALINELCLPDESASNKAALIGAICDQVIHELRKEKLSSTQDSYMVTQAESILHHMHEAEKNRKIRRR